MEVDAYIHLRLAHLIIIYYSINQGEVLGVQVNKFIILIMFIYFFFERCRFVTQGEAKSPGRTKTKTRFIVACFDRVVAQSTSTAHVKISQTLLA